MRRFRQLLHDSSGSVLILVAGLIFFVAAFTVLAVDVSKLLVTRAQLQNAADAGALAGAEMFMDNPVPDAATIEARARDLATQNRSYSSSDSKPVDNVGDVVAVAHTNPDEVNSRGDKTYGIVTCVTRSTVSQYFTALPGFSKENNFAPVKADKLGNVAATSAARAGSVCKVQCLKPWSIPDRWDDFSVPNAKGWSGNKVWDQEKFTDTNGNFYHDAGEPFQDGSSAWTKGGAGPVNGQYDEEYYHPLNTGYVAWKDLGLELTLKSGNPQGAQSASQYYPIDLPIPGDNSATGADRYRWNIANCNPSAFGPGDVVWTENGNMSGPTAQGMRDLVNADPGAYWDDGCQCVKSQYGDQSPRIVFIPLHDPRIPLAPGKQVIDISKIAAFFIESTTSSGDVKGRFVRVASPSGEICPPNANSGEFVFTISLVDPQLAR
jgi:putative Flp pilus-assembly TadE/G-like protein